MVRRYWGVVFFLLSCFGLFGMAGLAAAEDIAKAPDRRIFYANPTQCAFYPEDHLFLAATYCSIHAFDTVSGELRWSLESSYNRYCGFTLYARRVLGWSDREVFLVDPMTGKRIWARSKTTAGDFAYAHYFPELNRVLVTGEKDSILYDIEKDTETPIPAITGYIPVMASYDPKNICFRQTRWGMDNDHSEEWHFLDLENNTDTPGWRQPFETDSLRFLPLFQRGEVAELTLSDDTTQAIKFHDMHTGAVTRELTGIPGNLLDTKLLADGRHFYGLSEDLRTAFLIDSDTGAVTFSLSQEGQYFDEYAPWENTSGSAWIFSRDSENNRYAWPLEAGGTPQKVLDGRLVAPGPYRLMAENSGYMVIASRPCGLPYTVGAYSLDGTQRLSRLW